MKIKHDEIQIPLENPFQNCKLDRKKYSAALTDILNAYPSGFVLSINNQWGTGKTTFVKMWQQHLKNLGFQTIYFNAWENDFENNALTALMGELKTITNKSTAPKFKSALKKAAIFSKQIVPVLAQSVVNRYVDSNEIKDAIVGATKGITDVFENDVNEYAKKKKGISEFKSSLSEFILKSSNEKPLVFIIDELDRCRPNYAVSILEQIKHFFSISNIVFVISIDKIQLGHAIRGVYGSDLIDAEEYLKRFIDIEYTIPDPEINNFYNYLYDYFEYDKFFSSNERRKYGELSNEGKVFLEICRILFSASSVSLRKQEKIFSHARLALESFQKDEYVVPVVYLFLNYIKIVHEDLYIELKEKKLTVLEFQKKFLSIVKANLKEENENRLMWLEALLIIYYGNYFEGKKNRNNYYVQNSTTNKLMPVIHSVINPAKDEDFGSIFQGIDRSGNIGWLNLEYFINKIELLENLKR